MRLPVDREEYPDQEASFAFPYRAITALTAPQPGVEQVSQGVAENVEGVNDNRQAKTRPESQTWRHHFLSIALYQWFLRLLEEYLTVFPIGGMMALEMGFRLDLGDKVSVRKPDLAVLLHSNPVVPHPTDRSFHGVCDLCIEFLSDSTPMEVERDTVHKKNDDNFFQRRIFGPGEFHLNIDWSISSISGWGRNRLFSVSSLSHSSFRTQSRLLSK